MNELTKAFIQECKQKQDWKVRYKANYIQFDNYFKYSGKIEVTSEIIDRYIEMTGKYGMMLKKRQPVLTTKDPVVRYYFQNSNMTLIELGIHFNMCYKEISNRISKYLKTKTNEKGDKIFA